MTQTELAAVLKLYVEWLADNSKGRRADLSGANLSGANLYGAKLYNADLSRADLSRAYLSDANLTGANLSDANLTGANLSDANLSRADLSRAYLSRANLTGANLSDAKLPEFQLCPQNGVFEAYKKVCGNVVLKLRIEGPRTSSLIGRKCRTSKAFVMEAYGSDAKNASGFKSLHDPNFIYKVGEYVEAPNYDPDIRVECTSGIHFFMTRDEAEQY